MGNSMPVQGQIDFVHHQRLGPVKITEYYEQLSQQVVSQIQLSLTVQSAKMFERWKQEMNRIDDTQSKEILFLPQKYSFESDGVCGSSGKVKAIFQNMAYVLTGQIQNRVKINKPFEETQIWYLLYNMIRAASKFQRIKKKVGNMHPLNILINDYGQIKILSTCSLPGQLDNFSLMASYPESQVYLAPEELVNSITNNSYPPHVNPCLAEVFSIGVTVLSAGTLSTCEQLYERKKDSIKFVQSELQDLLSTFNEHYGAFLSDVLTDMLQINPSRRKCASDIYGMIYQFENEILNLQPFVPPERYLLPHESHMTGNSFNRNTFKELQAKNMENNQIMVEKHQTVTDKPLQQRICQNNQARVTNKITSLQSILSGGCLPPQSMINHQKNAVIPNQPQNSFYQGPRFVHHPSHNIKRMHTVNSPAKLIHPSTIQFHPHSQPPQIIIQNKVVSPKNSQFKSQTNIPHPISFKVVQNPQSLKSLSQKPMIIAQMNKTAIQIQRNNLLITFGKPHLNNIGKMKQNSSPNLLVTFKPTINPFEHIEKQITHE